ncbi:MAG: PIG-L family deacetylase, partial [Firmicutes bacterium]|nr:PIG-L family deacetylase [Bacillota bacterium]
LGYERQLEALDVLHVLGVSPESVHFLGFPDGGLDRLFTQVWTEPAWISPTTQTDHVPYMDVIAPQAPYTGQAALAAIRQLLADVMPEIIVSPHPLDQHPDHWASHAFAALALAVEQNAGKLWAQRAAHLTYLVHWPMWPLPMGLHNDLPGTVPADLLALDGRNWQEFVFDQEEIQRKKTALLRYQSQVELIKPFMLSFVRQTETFYQAHALPLSDSEWLSMSLPNLTGWAKLVKHPQRIAQIQWKLTSALQQCRLILRQFPEKGMEYTVVVHRDDSLGELLRFAPTVEKTGREAEGLWEVVLTWPRTVYGLARQVMIGMELSVEEKMWDQVPFYTYRLSTVESARILRTKI